MNKWIACLSVCCLFLGPPSAIAAGKPTDRLYAADHPYFQYTGRIDFSNPKLPVFWAPGVYITARFSGTSCAIVLHDERLYGNSHNYIAVIVDNKPAIRLQLKGRTDTIQITQPLKQGVHTLVICKNTEAGIGALGFEGLICQKLLPPLPPPARAIEFIGNSITCGTGSDVSVVPCDKGAWYDQHNAWQSYGPVTARNLHARWQLSAVSGIGLIHSCCNMTVTMPQVFDKMNMRNDTIAWNFKRYIPDVVTICLGQNDGIQDSTVFCSAYVRFILTIRKQYPKAQLVCLNSPMGDEALTAVMKKYITAVVACLNKAGDGKVHAYFYSRRYHNGCGNHPDLAEHQLIAGELTGFIRQLMHW